MGTHHNKVVVAAVAEDTPVVVGAEVVVAADGEDTTDSQQAALEPEGTRRNLALHKGWVVQHPPPEAGAVLQKRAPIHNLHKTVRSAKSWTENQRQDCCWCFQVSLARSLWMLDLKRES